VPSDAQAGERLFRTDIPPDPLEGRRAHTRKLEQDIQMISGNSELLFAAAEPTTILSRGRRTFMMDRSRIQSRFIYGLGSVLNVTSEISDATPDELRSAATDYPGEIKARYLTVPESCWQVEPLTRKVTAGKKSPYEKAEAIRDYLSQNFQYDLNTPATPAGEDPVPYFLFNEKRGYCDVFSSAMAVMCRQAGIPARWVTGFATGELDSKDGQFHVRIKDYHAWVEVYFPGYGWIEFDPTPGGGGGGVTKSKLMASLTKLMLRVQSDWPRMLIGLVIILLLAYLLKTEVWDRRLRFGRMGGTVVIRPSPAHDTYRMMCAVLGKFGFRRHQSVTPSEYASDFDARLPQELSHLAGAVKIITSDFEEARYSDRQVPPDRVERGVATLKALRAGLRDARKQRLLPTGNRK
jgi:transglutaminase-like putative cysteine protease